MHRNITKTHSTYCFSRVIRRSAGLSIVVRSYEGQEVAPVGIVTGSGYLGHLDRAVRGVGVRHLETDHLAYISSCQRYGYVVVQLKR